VKPIEVLLVEDSPADVFLIRHSLADEVEAFRLHVARDGCEAIEMVRSVEPDLIILDLKLPKVSGLAVLEETHPHVPVVVFSASTSPADIQRSFELGVRDFVPKPTDLDSYKRLVAYIVRKWGKLEPAIA
jgi:CheY-like chemotaxis protein